MASSFRVRPFRFKARARVAMKHSTALLWARPPGLAVVFLNWQHPILSDRYASGSRTSRSPVICTC
jgi:hypothetical protein